MCHVDGHITTFSIFKSYTHIEIDVYYHIYSNKISTHRKAIPLKLSACCLLFLQSYRSI